MTRLRLTSAVAVLSALLVSSPSAAETYVLMLLFSGGEPAAALHLTEQDGTPRRFGVYKECADAGSVYLKAAANPQKTVDKYTCIIVKPTGE